MRLRLVLASFVILLLTVVGLWTTAYFHIAKAQKEYLAELKEQGYEITLENVRTRGFPFSIHRTIDRFVVRSSKDARPTSFSQGGPISLQVGLFSPAQLRIQIGQTKSTFDRTVSWNFSSADATVSLDPANTRKENSVTFFGTVVRQGERELASYPKIASTFGIKNGSLHFTTSSEKMHGIGEHEFDALSFDGFFDTPFKSWQSLSKQMRKELYRLKGAVEDAVVSGETSIPLLQEWVNTLEEQQIAGHFSLALKKDPKDEITCKASLGVIEAMPHAAISIEGAGELFQNISSSIHTMAPSESLDKRIDLSLKKEGLYVGKTLMLPVQPIAWRTLPVINEAIVCDTFKLYSHGDYRKGQVDQALLLEDPDLQYYVGEGYVRDASYEKALSWFKMSARQHHPKSLLHLSYHYFNGYGCEKDESLAREFAEDAVCHGEEILGALPEFHDEFFIEWVMDTVGEKSPE